MVVGVVGFAFAAGHDAPGAPIIGAGGRHGVFVIVAMGLGGQQMLAIAEDRSVLAIGEGTAGIDLAASATLPASKSRPWARTLHAMRASLLARAIASTLRCNRLLAAIAVQKARGTFKGGWRGPLPTESHRAKAAERVKDKARRMAENVGPIIKLLRTQGWTYEKVADELNRRQIATPQNKLWSGVTVRHVLLRFEGLPEAEAA